MYRKTNFYINDKFQYIKCDGSAGYAITYDQPATQFQYIKCDGSASVSFSNRCPTWEFQYIKCDGSAVIIITPPILFCSFQYIKCDGSAVEQLTLLLCDKNFNTSNVMVQLNRPRTCVIWSRISIHQMWWFSDEQKQRYLYREHNFNTSNVMVQL